LKWDGTTYVPYTTADVRSLSASWFESKFDEAELFWAIRYRGLKTTTFKARWFAGVPAWSSTFELNDPMLGVRWVATFKGGVYAVADARSFLLLPRPGYKGGDRLELQGDWLAIYSTWELGLNPVARYNRRTQELQMLADRQ
jgi:hypothetical protein